MHAGIKYTIVVPGMLGHNSSVVVLTYQEQQLCILSLHAPTDDDDDDDDDDDNDDDDDDDDNKIDGNGNGKSNEEPGNDDAATHRQTMHHMIVYPSQSQIIPPSTADTSMDILPDPLKRPREPTTTPRVSAPDSEGFQTVLR